MKKVSVIIVLVLGISLFQYCTKSDNNSIANSTVTKQPNLPATPYDYNVVFPSHVQTALSLNDNTPANNAITNDGATLGRVLFYDKQLSKNNTISCGSCHKQTEAFDDDINLSKGFEGGFTSRNSMAVLNLRFYKSGKMFWDERAATLENQVLQPIQNHVEMGLTTAELETKVAALSYYPPLFQKAFGSTLIDSNRIAKALAQYCRSIVSYQSKYDSVKQGLTTFTANEAQGEQIFLTAGVRTCASCHTPPMFITSNPETAFALADPNDVGINGQNRFKSGTLRNIGLRKALFHNGSVANLQSMLTSNPAIPVHTVAPPDVTRMIAFLNTLTDYTVLTEAKFSDPFK
jgi:cytochrome c peroxidase